MHIKFVTFSPPYMLSRAITICCDIDFLLELKNTYFNYIYIYHFTSYPIAQRLFAMRRYGGGMLYAALPLHMQRGCFRIRTHDQQVTKAHTYIYIYGEMNPSSQTKNNNKMELIKTYKSW